ncbi:uncharacterized protein LOC120930279 [Rana temporaria]|uniref:uncharacterized protein LOC120930279 n=1 Tax=Rana temporaria TaxID=8407 RepID=UPI001AACCBFB|nr:uncharacterized protein LOC120930279 [Rana temporaria]
MQQLNLTDNLMRFIDQYRKSPCLWDARNPYYRNRNVRKATLVKFAKYMQTWIPEVTSTVIKIKINNLRLTYMERYLQVQASRWSGAAEDEVKEPELWYFNYLRFLDDQFKPRESLSSLPSRVPSTVPPTPAECDEEPDLRIFSEEEISQEAAAPEGVSQEEEGVSGSQEEAGPSGSQLVPRPSTVSQVPPLQMRPLRRKRHWNQVEEESLQLIREASALMRAPLNPVESYSSYLNHELQALGEEQRGLAKGIIANVIQWARRDQLTRTTILWDPAAAPPPTLSPPARGRGRNAARQPGRKTRK